MNHSTTLVSAQSKPTTIPPAPLATAINTPVLEGQWHHACVPQVIFWLTDLDGEISDTYVARFGANFWIFAQGGDGEEYAGYSFACDAGGHVGLIATCSIAIGWRPNALHRVVEEAAPRIDMPTQEYASAS